MSEKKEKSQHPKRKKGTRMKTGAQPVWDGASDTWETARAVDDDNGKAAAS